MKVMVSPAAMMALHSSGDKTSRIKRRSGTMGCLKHSVFGPSGERCTVSSWEVYKMAGCKLGGLRSSGAVVSMIRNFEARSGEQEEKMDLSSMLRRIWRVGSVAPRRSQVSCSAIGPEVELIPLEVMSVGPVTRRMASRTWMSS